MAELRGFVYVTRCLVTNKLYVGIHTQDKRRYLGSGYYLHRAIKKHGRKNFIRTIIQYYNSQEDLFNAEKYWIKTLNTRRPHGYNLTDGGEGILNPCSEIRQKMSKNNGMRKAEFRAKVGHSMLGNTNRRGKRAPFETRLKMSVAQQGRLHKPHTEETKEKIRIAQASSQIRCPRRKNSKGQYMENENHG